MILCISNSVQKYIEKRRERVIQNQPEDNIHEQDSFPLVSRRNNENGKGMLDVAPALNKRVKRQKRLLEDERAIIRPKDYRKKCTKCNSVNQGTNRNKYHLTYKKVTIGHECPKCYASRIRSHKKTV